MKKKLSIILIMILTNYFLCEEFYYHQLITYVSYTKQNEKESDYHKINLKWIPTNLITEKIFPDIDISEWKYSEFRYQEEKLIKTQGDNGPQYERYGYFLFDKNGLNNQNYVAWIHEKDNKNIEVCKDNGIIEFNFRIKLFLNGNTAKIFYSNIDLSSSDEILAKAKYTVIAEGQNIFESQVNTQNNAYKNSNFNTFYGNQFHSLLQGIATNMNLCMRKINIY